MPWSTSEHGDGMNNRSSLLAIFLLAAGWLDAGGQQPGSLIWAFKTGNFIYASPALDAAGVLYAGSADGMLYAINPDGTKRWGFQTGDYIGGSSAIDADGAIYVGSADHKFYAFNPDGTKKWDFTTGGYIGSSPAISPGGRIYFGSWDGKLYALDRTGTAQWSFTTGAEVYSSPAVGVDGVIYFGSRDNKIYALDSNGLLRWSYATGGWVDSSPAIGSGGVIYVGSIDGRLYALNPDGTKKWSFAAGGPVNSSPCLDDDGTVYFGSNDGKLYAVSPDGQQKWAFTTGGSIFYSSPAQAADGTVYIGSADAVFYAIGPDGVKKWSITTGAAISHPSPVIGPDGTVYFGSSDFKLYAVRGSSGSANTPWPAFRRDSRHTASGFVQRQLPAGYSPGLKTVVRLLATPPDGVSVYELEDQPPANWTVGNMSLSGWYDSVNRKIKFGPFFDATPRVLSYEITPPLLTSGLKTFQGLASANGLESFVGGDSSASLVPLHPADINPVDGWMSIAEATAYSEAWKSGDAWPVGPNPIPINYVTRAVALWRGGECYRYDTSSIAAPFFWVNKIPSPNPASSLLPSPPSTVVSNCTAISTMPSGFQPGVALRVSIAVGPASNILVYAAEDRLPDGWAVAQISDDGLLDATSQKVKWGPFFDNVPRVLSYQATPTNSLTNLVAFAGVASFNGTNMTITGQRQATLGGPQTPPASRLLPATYSPGLKLVVTLEARPPAGTAVYVIEDDPPDRWPVGSMSESGYFNPSSGQVEFGPFFDDLPRTLTYDVTPPITDSGVKTFLGLVSLDGLEDLVAGDSRLSLAPLHPADGNPVDGRIAIGEMTAYGAAWKRGRSWPIGPALDPVDYRDYNLRAIQLWQGGEHYRFDSNILEAPLWWVNTPQSSATNNILTNIDIPFPVPVANSAFVQLPSPYRPGQPLPITISAVPATGVVVYAVEHQPPAGWQVAGITGGGFYDAASQKVKWGPFFDDRTRAFSYSALPPIAATGPAFFAGTASFDGTNVTFVGQNKTIDTPLVVRLDSPVYLSAQGFQMTLTGASGFYYSVQATTNLLDWVVLTNFIGVGDAWPVVDPAATNFPQRFYRMRAP